MSVRDLIKAMQIEIRDSDLQPDRAADLLVKLTALIGNCLDEIRVAEAAYRMVLLAHLDQDEAASRSKIRAQASPEYGRFKEARDTKEIAVELSRSLKYFLTAKRDELQLARHQ